LQKSALGATIKLGNWYLKFMKEEQKRKKALLIVKIVMASAILLIIALFSIIIAQTVEINDLQNQIYTQTEYSSEATE
jgi:lipopolysaccharide/colanic/teichoic acid biosynthesis glycosyltransferase